MITQASSSTSRTTPEAFPSSTFDPSAAMPGMRAPSERSKAVGDINFDDDGMEEQDAAMGFLMSLGMPGNVARRTLG
eukprot:3391015-Heterocapsa_arctica.AAC.1